ncbi:MAG TPA: methyltransferase domain-containing protein [Acidimicrobiales bacterium]|nr:methyltransferase domain-containing protein [Acidimicrobiales bacterium]
MSETGPVAQITELARRLVPEGIKAKIRPRLGPTNEVVAPPAAATKWAASVGSPWDPSPTPAGDVVCNICHWSGASFAGAAHCEAANCPRCGSIARDRFLFFCMQQRIEPSLGCTTLETSPRMGDEYRSAMAGWFDYLCSDFDESMHKAMVRIDLQDIDLDDASIDLVLTPHVLEHVPDTGRALREIHRVLRPGGTMLLQVPVLQGRTAPPATPEFHGDDTPVFWRFGYDLAAVLAEHGFDVHTLVTEEWAELVASGTDRWDGDVSGEFDDVSMFSGTRGHEFEIVADREQSRRFGFEPAYMFLTWECRKPSP